MALREWFGRRRGQRALLLGVPLALVALLAVALASNGPGDSGSGEPGDAGDGASRVRAATPTTGSTTPSSTTGSTAPPTTPTTPAGWWRPTKGMTWQWQLDGRAIDTSVDAEVFDVDLFETPESTIRQLHDQGRKVICYFSAGSWEPYRPDAGDYPESVKGGAVDGWPDERWLDIRQLDVLRPLIAARLDQCAAKGADGAEPDWMDSYAQDTGWDITAAGQLAFNHMIADLAHDRGLAIGLKNDLDQVADLAETFDFAVVEQCAEFRECEKLVPFLDRNKPVFHAEYDLETSEFCPESRRLGISSIRKRLELDAWRETC